MIGSGRARLPVQIKFIDQCIVTFCKHSLWSFLICFQADFQVVCFYGEYSRCSVCVTFQTRWSHTSSLWYLNALTAVSAFFDTMYLVYSSIELRTGHQLLLDSFKQVHTIKGTISQLLFGILKINSQRITASLYLQSDLCKASVYVLRGHRSRLIKEKSDDCALC